MAGVFVDTGVWFSALVQEASASIECNDALAAHAGRVITTDFVIDELLTLFAARGHRDVAMRYGQALLDGALAEVHWLGPDDIQAGWEVFRRFHDKQWSFTDCTSYAVMQRLGITEALSLDDHFRQFAFVAVRP